MFKEEKCDTFLAKNIIKDTVEVQQKCTRNMYLIQLFCVTKIMFKYTKIYGFVI